MRTTSATTPALHQVRDKQHTRAARNTPPYIRIEGNGNTITCRCHGPHEGKKNHPPSVTTSGSDPAVPPIPTLSHVGTVRHVECISSPLYQLVPATPSPRTLLRSSLPQHGLIIARMLNPERTCLTTTRQPLAYTHLLAQPQSRPQARKPAHVHVAAVFTS
jgi:hypothetical protein